ncbi:MAG TPA: hypothetical protein V6D50_20105 [Chroococcales cyanobacterium]
METKLTANEIYTRYLETLQDDREAMNNFRSGIIKYFIPSLGGPIPNAEKYRPLSQIEIEAALNYLNSEVSLAQLASCHEHATKTLSELKVSDAQRERIRRALHQFVDWGLNEEYLPPPHNPIPQETCAKIPLRNLGEYDLEPTTPLHAYLEYHKHLEGRREQQNNITNVLARYFVPAVGGPLVTHLQFTGVEMDAAHQCLETVSMAHLDKAVELATVAMKALGVSLTQRTRLRSALKDFLDWCRKQRYLPLIPDSIPAPPWLDAADGVQDRKDELVKCSYTSLQIYEAYCDHLKAIDKPNGVGKIQSAVVRYLVPAMGGPSPKSTRTSPDEIKAGIAYLEKIPAEQLKDGCTEADIDRKIRTELKGWLEWAESQRYFELVAFSTEEIQFNLIRKVGEHRTKKRHTPGAEMHERRVAVHQLCAKQFPDDYINEALDSQIRNFWEWWQSEGAVKGTIDGTEEQLMQLLGWLHRYEGISLEELALELLITKSKLIPELEIDIDNIDEESDLDQYDEQINKLASLKVLLKTRAQFRANQDMKRVERYLKFLKENHPGSKQKRIALIIAIAKFLYREEIGTEDFPTPNSIPILWRLLNKQAELGAQNKTTPRTVRLNHENILPWGYAVRLVMIQKKRCDRYILYNQSSQHKKGYTAKSRRETGLAKELQNFLSIALPVIAFPSRSRTYYDLRIGETFKEGCFVEGQFRSKEQLEKEGILKNYEDRIGFYIHHMVDDSKIGKTIAGEWEFGWWALIPDYEFPDGSRLYQYIRRWLDWGRPVLGATWHNNFFVKRNTNKPADCDTWRSRIKNMFNREFGVCVPPQHLRIMYSTSLSAHNASQEVKDAAACALEHSRKIHDEKYDMLASVRRIEPAIAFNMQYMDRVLNETGLTNQSGNPASI